MKRQYVSLPPSDNRRGSALLAVLVIVAMLSLAAYTYSEVMLAEYEASIRTGLLTESRTLADSGVDWTLSLVALKASEEPPDLFNNPDQFHQIVVQEGTEGRPVGYFSVVAPVDAPSSTAGVRFGLRNESAKLNLNALANSGLTEDEVRFFLMELPSMTESIADAILDWIDADTEARYFGAEAEAYANFYPPRKPKNAPLLSLDELLAVDGVTATLLYGEDTNRNGLLDANEDDAGVTEPFDNADGILDAGWSDYLTVTARESNLRLDGSPKIPLNTNTLTDLYDQLDEEFGEEVATFVVAYRIFGPSNRDEFDITPTGLAGGDFSDLSLEDQAILDDLAEGISDAIANGGQVTRNGMDLSSGGDFEIRSLYDLVDAEVEAQMEGGQQTLVSPWSSDSGSLSASFPVINEAFGVIDSPTIEGRINVNEARFETLMGIPAMTEELASSIVSAGHQLASGRPNPDLAASRSTNCWLMVEGLVDLETMRLLDPYITSGGDVLTAQVVGYFSRTGISTRLKVMIDASESPPTLLSVGDYSRLGAGYSLFDWQQGTEE
ncbi:MAG: general secretion pathway protein GspK [Planctomycetaceae bacterium]|nr:general secretion pathway protein GspK [Planctomycetaceae bacterium]